MKAKMKKRDLMSVQTLSVPKPMDYLLTQAVVESLCSVALGSHGRSLVRPVFTSTESWNFVLLRRLNSLVVRSVKRRPKEKSGKGIRINCPLATRINANCPIASALKRAHRSREIYSQARLHNSSWSTFLVLSTNLFSITIRKFLDILQSSMLIRIGMRFDS